MTQHWEMVAQYLPEVMNPILQLFIPFSILESKSATWCLDWGGGGGKAREGWKSWCLVKHLYKNYCSITLWCQTTSKKKKGQDIQNTKKKYSNSLLNLRVDFIFIFWKSFHANISLRSNVIRTTVINSTFLITKLRLTKSWLLVTISMEPYLFSLVINLAK